MPPKSKFKELIDNLGIDETFTKSTRKENKFTHVKNQIPLQKNWNFMADLLFLPKTKKGYHYLLVVVDLATDVFDIEPLQKKDAEYVRDAMKRIFKRGILKLPKYSIQTDAGSEFKGVFHKWIYDNNILHRTARAGRHSQMSNVESLNKQLGRLLLGYLNKKEKDTGKYYYEWTDMTNKIRDELNKIRKKPEKSPYTHDYPVHDIKKTAKFKVGDLVHYKLDEPRDNFNQKQAGKFRTGDLHFDPIAKRITEVIFYTGDIPFRYALEGITNATYTEGQLKLSTQQEETYRIKKIIGKKRIRGITKYLIWWDGYKRTEATYEPEDKLIEDGFENLINEYNNN